MTLSLDEPPASKLRGDQRPRILAVPPYVSSAGQEAVELAKQAGLELDPWQAFVLSESLGERVNETWAAFEVGLVVGRQNGKGSILEARELAGLFLFKERLILHSAHQVRTTTEAFIRIKALLENSDALRRRVKRINHTHGEEGVELLGGQRLRFIARSRVSGRGFSGDVVILDEAFELPEAAMAALFPTMSAKPNPQIWYTSSAVNQEVHPHGRVLARVRRRGMTGKAPRLAYFEWSKDLEGLSPAEREMARTDRRVWAGTNPGLGIRISEEFIESELGALSAKDFDVERLGAGDWPVDDASAWTVVSKDVWDGLVDLGSRPADPVAFAADVTPVRTHGAIASAGLRDDGLLHVEVVEHRPDTAWMVPRLLELYERWDPCAIAVSSGGEAASLIAPLEAAGVPLLKLSAREEAQAHGQFLESTVDAGELRHLGQPMLAAALAGAVQRDLGDAKAWARKTSTVDISPLVAVTNAAFAYRTRGPAETGLTDVGIWAF